MNNPLSIYSTLELIAALQFYCNGPKENRQLRDMVESICDELLTRFRDQEYVIADEVDEAQRHFDL